MKFIILVKIKILKYKILNNYNIFKLFVINILQY